MALERGRARFHRRHLVLQLLESTFSKLPRRMQRLGVGFLRASDSEFSRAVRYVALRCVSQSCGELIDLKSNCVVLAPERLVLGSRISIHPFCYLDATGTIEIGSDVSIAHSTSILSTNHIWESLGVPIRDQGITLAKTVIEDDVWVGAGVRILAGTTVGTGAIVAAGAVVTKDVPAYAVVGGVPARVLRTRS
ncbi:MAG TPA: acyltransferase [Nitrospira sp.]|nr:acyltransferase [Nitrospira sp.]